MERPTAFATCGSQAHTELEVTTNKVPNMITTRPLRTFDYIGSQMLVLH